MAYVGIYAHIKLALYCLVIMVELILIIKKTYFPGSKFKMVPVLVSPLPVLFRSPECGNCVMFNLVSSDSEVMITSPPSDMLTEPDELVATGMHSTMSSDASSELPTQYSVSQIVKLHKGVILAFNLC